MHSILYDNAFCDWNEALPIGNGVFGGMVFFDKGKYTLALNHYEVYYSIYERYSKQYQEKLSNQEISFNTSQYSYNQLCEMAKNNFRDYTKEAYIHYRKTIWPDVDLIRQKQFGSGVSHPATGEISFNLKESYIDDMDFSLGLDIENANIKLDTKKDDESLSIKTIVFNDCDAVLSTIRQSKTNNIENIEIEYPQRRNHAGFTYSFAQTDSNTVIYTVEFYPVNEDKTRFNPFKFAVATRVIGADISVSINDNKAILFLENAQKDLGVLTYVLTELTAEKVAKQVIINLNNIEQNVFTHIKTHENHWNDFFAKSSICIPDKFLEKLWYYNLYISNCCSGKSGRRFEQASGLNGLWDIRQPTIWGSLWYWDVNIQASFWPFYTANHLEIAQVFNDGFLSYADGAKQRAEDLYEVDGCAIDYPHEFYNCMGPWCSQFLWWYYEYSQDVEFLKERAYPFFKEQIRFIKNIIKFDEEKKQYYFFPDVSPEQGPITRNSTITLATVRYLLEFSLKANKIIGGSEDDICIFEEILEKLPAYPTDVIDKFGEVIKDSELAPAGIHLRHPSLLMPIFPIGEIDAYSTDDIKKIAGNTVEFASENSEIGVFPFGWIAAAFARMGDGNKVLKLLYEQGFDLIYRANGMGAEETDRWVNHCAVDFGELYYPFMMECVGEVTNCVNEMLLQSHNGIIDVFPAIPNGRKEKNGGAYTQEPLINIPLIDNSDQNWENCSFDSLLAKGGFEVSGTFENGNIERVVIKSLYGNEVKVRIKNDKNIIVKTRNNEHVKFEILDDVIFFKTIKNESYVIYYNHDELPTSIESQQNIYNPGFHYTSHLGRQVFFGKDKNTDMIKLLDSFLFDYYVANDRYHQVIPYKLNFGVDLEKLSSVVGPGEYRPQQLIEKSFLKITTQTEFTNQLGVGFSGDSEVYSKDTSNFNELLQDCIYGYKKCEFIVDLPKGIYEILVVSGFDENSTTYVSCKNSKIKLINKANNYKADVMLVNHNRCGKMTLTIESEDKRCWNINLLVIKKISSLM